MAEQIGNPGILRLNKDGSAIFTIQDDQNWKQPYAHVRLVQQKVNSFLEFVASGQLFSTYPRARGRMLVLRLVFSHPPSEEGETYLETACKIVGNAGMHLRWELEPGIKRKKDTAV